MRTQPPTKLLDQAFATARQASPETQDAIARLMLDMMAEDEPEAIAPEHLAALIEGESQANRGEFASEAEVAEAFRRFRG